MHPHHPTPCVVRLPWVACLFTIVLWLAAAAPAAAQLNLAIGKPIIDGSGSWDGGTIGVGQPYDGGTFPARLAVDGLKSEPDNGTPNWWLGREQTPEEYFTLLGIVPSRAERVDSLWDAMAGS